MNEKRHVRYLARQAQTRALLRTAIAEAVAACTVAKLEAVMAALAVHEQAIRDDQADALLGEIDRLTSERAKQVLDD